MDKKVIKEIQKLAEKIIKDNNLNDKTVIRDDVFNILQNIPNCIVIYYPIDTEANEDGCDGCHVVRTVKGIEKQLVFINTANTGERQAFSVAHELGHIWNVDGQLKDALPDTVFDVEEVINRFAAELLMPEELFIAQLIGRVRHHIPDNNVTVLGLIKIIVYLMNYFYSPYKAVVLRMEEIGFIDKNARDHLLTYKDSQIVKDIIQEEQYTRLGIITEKKSIANLSDKLDEIEEKQLFPYNKIMEIRKEFGLSSIKKDKEMNEVIDINDLKGLEVNEKGGLGY